MRSLVRFSTVCRFAFVGMGVAGIAALSAGRAAQAQTTLSQSTGGTGLSGSAQYVGQSFTTASGGPYSSIVFTFFSDTGSTTPYAAGTGYLFSTQYQGTPSGLSSSAAGYLGQAVASGGTYSFGNSVTLAGGTKYYFYEDALIPAGGISGGGFLGTNVQTGNSYTSTGAGSAFTFVGFPGGPSGLPFGPSTNFRVTGTTGTAAVPEPGVWVTAASLAGTLSAGLIRGRRRMSKGPNA